MRGSPRAVPENCGDVLLGIKPGKDGSHLLCAGLDAAVERSADHSRGFDPSAASRQHRTTWRRHSRSARACLDSRFNRYPDSLRHSAWLLADAESGVELTQSCGLSCDISRSHGLVVELRQVHRQPAQCLLRRGSEKRERVGLQLASACDR